jgi:uncharacterized protein YjiS (DUF1127 family)
MSASNCNETILTPALPLENAGWRMLQRVAPALADAAMVQFATLCAWQCRAEMRQRMIRLDDNILDDIGLSRTQVEAEAAKPFWKK